MRHAIAALGLLGLAACDQPAATGNQVTPRATERVDASGARWQAEDACGLLDKATVGAALGKQIVRVEAGPVVPRTDQAAGFSTCYYVLADDQRLAFMARQSPVADNSPEAMKRARDEVVEMMGPVTDVTGVGRSAFWVPRLRQLVVFIGQDRYFNLTMPENLGGKDPKTLALALATRIE